MGVRMDIETVRRIGEKVTAVAATIDNSFTPHTVDLVPGRNSPCPDWATAGVAASAVASWRAFVTTLHDSVANHGLGLVNAANAHAETDGQAADRTQRAGRPTR